MSPPSCSFSKTLRTSPSGKGLIFAMERTSHRPLIRERMNASFGVNDQDMSSSIGRVSDGMAEMAIELGGLAGGGAGKPPCEGGGDFGGGCDARKDTDVGGAGPDGVDRNTLDGGGTGGQGTDEGGAPISRKEDAARSVVWNEPVAGGRTGAETGGAGMKLVDGGGAGGGAATGAAIDVVTGPGVRARFAPLSGPRRRNRVKSFGGAGRPSGGGGGIFSSSAVSRSPSKWGVAASAKTVS